MQYLPSHRRRRLGHYKLRNFPLPIRMTTAKLRIESTQLGRVVNSSPDEMLHTCLSCQLVDTNSPIDFGFFTDSESVGVDKCGISASKDPAYICIIVAPKWHDGDMR